MSAALATIAQAWREAEQRQYSACNHCEHSTWHASELACACPDLTRAGQPVPVQILRRHGASCGPEAVFMAAAWLRAA